MMTSDFIGRPMLMLPEALAALVEGNEASRFIGSRRAGNGDMLPYSRTPNGTAIIPVLGPLANRAGGWLMSYEALRYQLDQARRDPAVKAVALDIQSPGGQAIGAFETAEAVRALAAAKPVVAVVNGMAASAAYAIASGATKIITTPSGVSGSIGVAAIHADLSGALDKAGITPTLIFAGARKVDGNPYQALSEEARHTMQAEVDQLYQQFVSIVAAGRPKLSPATIRATEARTYIGVEAVKAGLADEVGTFETALALLPGLRPTGRAGSTAATSAATLSGDTDPMAEADFYRGCAAGRTAERNRIAAILALPEAKGREAEARRLALKTDSTVDAVKAALANGAGAGAYSPEELAMIMNKQLGAAHGPQVTGDRPGAVGETAAKAEPLSKADRTAGMWDDIVAAVNLEVAPRRGSRGADDRPRMNDNAAPASAGEALSPEDLAAVMNREAGLRRDRG